MPSKREVLEQLKRDELLDALDRFGLEVHDRRARAGLLDALASSRKASLIEVLETLPRTRLKEICRALGLDDSGREKALLIARLTGPAIQARSSNLDQRFLLSSLPLPCLLRSPEAGYPRPR